MIKAFLTSFILTSVLIFTMHNANEINASLTRSEQYLKEIKQAEQHLKILNTYYNF